MNFRFFPICRFLAFLLASSASFMGLLAQPAMVSLSAGAFAMGDAHGDGLRDELPVRTVTVSAFAIGNFPVTRGEWRVVRTWGLSNGYTDLPDLGTTHSDDHPASGVSWYDAVKWCNARSEFSALTPVYYTTDVAANQNSGTVYRTGIVDLAAGHVRWADNGFRLPTEAEWEKAARGGLSDKRFPRGDTISHSDANYVSSPASYDLAGSGRSPLQQWTHPSYSPAHDPNANAAPTSPPLPYTSEIGEFIANGFGLQDMAGNIWQLCWDRYNDAYYASTGNTADPRGPTSGATRVLRGGSWDSIAFFCRVSNRAMDYPDRRLHGFRVVRSL